MRRAIDTIYHVALSHHIVKDGPLDIKLQDAVQFLEVIHTSPSAIALSCTGYMVSDISDLVFASMRHGLRYKIIGVINIPDDMFFINQRGLMCIHDQYVKSGQRRYVQNIGDMYHWIKQKKDLSYKTVFE